ncbi:transcription factor IIIB 50 kDa subunit [Lampris incognitus]|uniref:transcription factor IIIB 50 kDa subunit n=1 Tax=Lampris incognitus TaxID=2546036 RepID=UPI0024B62B73|nr:transcription factor IIIB 50 kDa subunit [Lampris incognitus]
MSSVGVRCPDCGSSDVVEDDLFSQSQRVCADCGYVLSEDNLTAQHSEGTDVRYSQTTAVAKLPCRNQIKGLQRVCAICRTLRLNRTIEARAQTYYKQAYEHPNFIKVRLQKKETLTGCCVLVSCRLHQWPVTIGTISCLLEADPVIMAAVYKKMVKTLNIEPPIFGITDVIDTHCQEYKLSSPHVPEELAENVKDLTKRAVALVELAADSWIVTGRTPVPIMMASVFLAWQSLKPTKIRLKFSLGKFCELAKVKKHKAAVKRITEMKEVLCRLGQELPWKEAEVKPDNVMHLVGDILEHRYGLLWSALRTHEESLLSELQPRLEDTALEIQTKTPCQIVGKVEQTPAMSCMDTCESNAGSDQQKGDEDTNLCTLPKLSKDTVPQGSQATAAHWTKRVLFCPPSARNAKCRRVEGSLQKDITGDEDISDSEIDTYIRTPQEVREFCEARKLLDFDNISCRDV